MKILISITNPDLPQTDFLQGNVIAAPTGIERNETLLFEELIAGKFTAYIAHCRPSDQLLRDWHEELGVPVMIAFIIGAERSFGNSDIRSLQIPDISLDSIAIALRSFERANTCALLSDGLFQVPKKKNDVVLIGAGIVNLITAMRLVEDDLNITVVDSSPELGGDWSSYGCTHSGDDARMFTFTEMDSYNNRDYFGKCPGYFRQRVTEGGWFALGRELSSVEEAWVCDFERIPSWLARSYNDDIFGLSVEAFHIWNNLIKSHRTIFGESFLQSEIHRLYSSQSQHIAAVRRHERIGAFVRDLTPGLSADNPTESNSPLSGKNLAGGFVVPGFTVNVHKLVKELIKFLTKNGVEFIWGTTVKAAIRDTDGRIVGFESDMKIPADADVVVSPGAYGDSLLAGTPCAGKIQGVLGGWMRIPNLVSLQNSLKLTQSGHITEDANVTVAKDADGCDVLIIGSGYGYIGMDHSEISTEQLEAIQRGIYSTIRDYFPETMGNKINSSCATESYGFKYCVRPWTSTSLGLFHAEQTANKGVFVVTGGHNTGGFAQAPSIAEAVSSALKGRPHPMHWLYNPERFESFVENNDPFQEGYQLSKFGRSAA